MREHKQLEPVRVGRVIVHEWLYGWTYHDGVEFAFTKICYKERIVERMDGEKEWRIVDGRSPTARRLRAERTERAQQKARTA